MALVDEKNLIAEAAKRARFRVHHVGTKLNEEERHELEALAAKRSQTQGGADPGILTDEIEQEKTSHRASVEMVEITACLLPLTDLASSDCDGPNDHGAGVRWDRRRGEEAQGECGGGPGQRSPIAALSNRKVRFAVLVHR